MGPSPAGLALSLHNGDTGTDAPKEDVAPGAGREETSVWRPPVRGAWLGSPAHSHTTRTCQGPQPKPTR